jgi:hypothetical protein
MARKIGMLMSEFRATTYEFKETWQREVNFEEEAKAFDVDGIESETVTRTETVTVAEPIKLPESPAIKQVDPSTFDHKSLNENGTGTNPVTVADENSKENWL